MPRLRVASVPHATVVACVVIAVLATSGDDALLGGMGTADRAGPDSLIDWTSDGSDVVDAHTSGSAMISRVLDTLSLANGTRERLRSFRESLALYEDCLAHRGKQPDVRFAVGEMECDLVAMPGDLLRVAGTFFDVDQPLAHLCFTAVLIGQYNSRDALVANTLLALAEHLGGAMNCSSTVPLYERALAVLENKCRAAGRPGWDCVAALKGVEWRKSLEACRDSEWSVRPPKTTFSPLVFVRQAAKAKGKPGPDSVPCPTCQCVTTGCVRSESVREFLALAKSGLQRFLSRGRFAFFGSETIHAVLGNESGDLDSVISAIVHAFHMWRTKNPSDPTLIVPILNMRRRDFESRPEVARVLRGVGIDPDEHLVFIDGSKPLEGPLELSPDGLETDVDGGAGFLDPLLDEGVVRITLVDHNAPTPRQAHIEGAVVDVIDHHRDEERVRAGAWGLDDLPPFVGRRKTIVLVGSCATLVAERMISESPHSYAHPGETEGTPFIDCAAARLLLHAIIADTHALNETRGSTTPRDVDALQSLLRACPGALDGKDPSQIHAEIVAAKEDVAAMSTLEVLARDFKQTACGRLLLGVSAVPVAIHKLAAREDFAEAANEFVSGRRLDLYAIISDQKGKRKLALAAIRDNPVAHAAVQSFGESADARELELTPLRPSKAAGLRAAGFLAFKQHNSKASRKVILPLLRRHIEDCLYQ